VPRDILIVSQYYHPDITAAAFRVKETAELLAARGHRVRVIAAEPHRGLAHGVPPAIVDTPGVQVTRVPIDPLGERSRISFLRHYFSFMGRAVRAGIRQPEPCDVVLASSPPLFVGVAGWLIARWRGARFFLDVRDLWPDSAVTVGQLRRDSLLYQAARKVERALYRKAGAISCVAQPMAAEIAQTSGGRRPVIVYNGIPAAYLADDPEVDTGARQTYQAGRFHLLYIGNMGYCQNCGLLLDAAAQAGAGDDTVFHLVGEGAERGALEERSRRENLGNVRLAGPVGKREAMGLMRAADALFLQLKPDETMEKTIPSKVFDYLAAGRPILFSLAGEGRQILERTGANLFFRPGDPADFLAALRKLRADLPGYAARAQENRELARREFSREAAVDRLEHRLQAMFHDRL